MGIGQYALLDTLPPPVSAQPGVQQFFKFYLDSQPSQFLSDCASLGLKNLRDSYDGSITKLVDFKLTDESGWGTSNLLDSVNAYYLQSFQNYLSNLPQVVQGTYQPPDFVHLGPNDPPVSSWSDSRIVATGGSAKNQPIETRRRFFWTMRFLTDQAAQGFQAAKEAMKNTFQIQMNIYTNWTQFQGRWSVRWRFYRCCNGLV